MGYRLTSRGSATQQDLGELRIRDLKDLAALQRIGKPGRHLVLALQGRRHCLSSAPMTTWASNPDVCQAVPRPLPVMSTSSQLLRATDAAVQHTELHQSP